MPFHPFDGVSQHVHLGRDGGVGDCSPLRLHRSNERRELCHLCIGPVACVQQVSVQTGNPELTFFSSFVLSSGELELIQNWSDDVCAPSGVAPDR
jgi:hypothetical protein